MKYIKQNACKKILLGVRDILLRMPMDNHSIIRKYYYIQSTYQQ